jgi:hypothetical protein
VEIEYVTCVSRAVLSPVSGVTVPRVTRARRKSFESESELVEIVSGSNFKKQRPKHWTFEATEFSLGRRIADLVIGIWEDEPSLGGVEKELAAITLSEARFLSELVRRPLRSQTVAKRMFLTQTEASRLTKTLQNMALIQMTDSGLLSVAEWKAELPKLVVSMEAKLHAWKEAVNQAAFYKQFSDYSAVVMPVPMRDEPRLLSDCKHNGLGLYLFSRYGQVTEAVRPRRVKAREKGRRHMTAVLLLQAVARRRLGE